MSQYHVDRIASVLEQRFFTLIDMSDWERKPDPDRRNAFLSRAVAALCIAAYASVSDDVAAQAVVDGYNDGGIDAILFDQANSAFCFVQSKWSQDGTGCLDEAAATKFAGGVRDILSAKIDLFNEKVKRKEPEIQAALRATGSVRILMVTAHVGAQEIGPHARRKVDELIEELCLPSDPDGAAAYHLNQEKVYNLITAFTKPPKIDLPITLRYWGWADRPFLSYYGRANIIEVASWWRTHKTALCDRNIRHFFLQRTAVNDALRETLATHPEYFWYFNNGITIICDSVDKTLAGSPGRDLGLFNCRGVSVVNGAQTGRDDRNNDRHGGGGR